MPVDRFGEVNSEGKQRLRFNLNGMILLRPTCSDWEIQAIQRIKSFVFTFLMSPEVVYKFNNSIIFYSNPVHIGVVVLLITQNNQRWYLFKESFGILSYYHCFYSSFYGHPQHPSVVRL